jgi:hypothetical protein
MEFDWDAFMREFNTGIKQILKEDVIAPLQNRIAALEGRLNRLELAREQDAAATAKTLRVVGGD